MMTPQDALSPDTVLNGNFRITAVLGRDGFSITYKAIDLHLDVVRVIEEYSPYNTAIRGDDGSVRVSPGKERDVFDWGLRRTYAVTKALARLHHRAVVSPISIFEQNGTIYTVFEFIDGESLAAWSNKPSNRSNTAVEALAIHMLDALEHIHSHQILHLDLAPDNVIVRPDGTPVFTGISVGFERIDEAHSNPFNVIRHNYSPPEQYSNGGVRGPATDIYALGATLYFVVTGAPPPPSTHRLVGDDPLVPASVAADGRFSPVLLHAIDAALRLRISERPRSAAEMRDMLRRDEHARPAQSAQYMGHSDSRPSSARDMPRRVEHASPAQPAPYMASPESRPSSAPPAASYAPDPRRERRRKALGIVRDPSTPITSDALAEQHRRERKAGEPATSPSSAAASVFAPSRMRARATALIQVFLHTPTDAGRAATLATAVDPARGRQITQDLSLPLRKGDKVRVDYDCAGLNVLRATDRSQIISWTGQPRSVNFEVLAPFTFFGRTHRPVINFTLLGGAPVSLGHIQFVIDVGLRVARVEAHFTGEARRHGRAFLSYAAEDRTEVLKRAQAFRAAGVEIFQDILELEPGERWERRLYEEIDQADVFYLFWSASARRSKWVRKEARQALKRQQVSAGGAPRIVPIALESPPPPPPRFLRHMHFGDSIGALIPGQAATARL